VKRRGEPDRYWKDGAWVGPPSLRVYLRKCWFGVALKSVIAIVVAFGLWPERGLRLRFARLGFYVHWSLPAIPFAIIAAAIAVVLLSYMTMAGFVGGDGD
jgi:hypothetical protein